MKSIWHNFILWFDSEASVTDTAPTQMRVNWQRCLPFITIHLGCLGIFWVGWSGVAVWVCLGLFWLRMFAITAFYHRYFSHRSFKATRFWQFVFAVLGNSAGQRGALWWASHHRKHHRFSDRPNDIHSPIQYGFWWSHMNWFMSDAGFKTDYSCIKDLAKFPELRFLNRFDVLVPLLLAIGLFFIGEEVARQWPNADTSGWQFLVWGFFISTVLLFHATFTINSLSHRWGKRRFLTKDNSRNNIWLALLTLGEGWHNNHHRFCVSTRQGFYWWEIDISYSVLRMLSWLDIVKDLTPVPTHVLAEGRSNTHKLPSLLKKTKI